MNSDHSTESVSSVSATESDAVVYWYSEHLALIVTTLKWAVLGSLAGTVTGALTRFFLWMLANSTDTAALIGSNGYHYYYLLPLSLPLSVWLIRRFAPDARGHGTEAVIASVNLRSGFIDWAVAPVKLIATILTLSFGGSAGREGPCAQIGAAATSLLATRLRLSDADRRCLVICGISGGFAAVFGTPLSGAIFGIEVLKTGMIEYPILFPSLIAGLSSHLVCSEITPVPHLQALSGGGAQLALFPLSILFGILFGLTALLLIEGMRGGKRIVRRFGRRPYLLAAGSGMILVGYYSLFGDAYAGLSRDMLRDAFEGGKNFGFLSVLLKVLATVLTLEAGGSGGVINTMFCAGAVAGASAARLLGLDPSPFAAMGFIAVLGAGANTPITACLMSLELLPHPYGLYAALASVTAYLIVGHRSVYPSQQIGVVKSGGLDLPLGLSYAELSFSAIKIRKGSLTERLHRLRSQGKKTPVPPVAESSDKPESPGGT